MSEEFVGAVESAAETELARLGSQKYLLAVTDATLEPPVVLAAAVDAHHHARLTLERWADDEADEGARQAIRAAAGRERQARGKIAAEVQSFGVTHSPMADPGALQAHLRGIDDTPERIGAGLVGLGLVNDYTVVQFVSFFVNEGDERRANLFRRLRETLGKSLASAEAALDDRSEDERERARDAAVEAIEVAYGEYADALEAMGLDPKPTC